MSEANHLDEVVDVCRWCHLPVRRGQMREARLVHVASDEGFCADGMHVAETPPPPARAALSAPCSLCGTWVPVVDAAAHWPACPGAAAGQGGR